MTRADAERRVQQIWDQRPRDLREYPGELTRNSWAKIYRHDSRRYSVVTEVLMEEKGDHPWTGWRPLTLISARTLAELVFKFERLARGQGWLDDTTTVR